MIAKKEEHNARSNHTYVSSFLNCTSLIIHAFYPSAYVCVRACVWGDRMVQIGTISCFSSSSSFLELMNSNGNIPMMQPIVMPNSFACGGSHEGNKLVSWITSVRGVKFRFVTSMYSYEWKPREKNESFCWQTLFLYVDTGVLIFVAKNVCNLLIELSCQSFRIKSTSVKWLDTAEKAAILIYFIFFYLTLLYGVRASLYR